MEYHYAQDLLRRIHGCNRPGEYQRADWAGDWKEVRNPGKHGQDVEILESQSVINGQAAQSHAAHHDGLAHQPIAHSPFRPHQGGTQTLLLIDGEQGDRPLERALSIDDEIRSQDDGGEYPKNSAGNIQEKAACASRNL